MRLSLSDLKALTEEAAEEPIPGGRMLAVIRVNEPGYAPAGVTVRSRIDADLFTAEFPAERLGALRADSRVASVEPAKRLSTIT